MLTSIALLPHARSRRAVFSPDGSRFVVADAARLAVYGGDGELRVHAELTASGGLRPFVFGIAWSEDDVHVATAENPTLRLRRAADLSIVAENEQVGMGPVAFCAGGRRLAVGANDRSLHVLDVPSLAERGALELEVGRHESFDIDHVVADPAGTLVAATDYGGYSEDEWGHTSERGVPKLTLVNASDPTRSTCELMQTKPITELALDRWRRRLLVGNYERIVVRELDGALVCEWAPYGKTAIRALAVCERFVATLPDITWGASLTVDFWEPRTYGKLGSVPLLAGTPRSVLLSRGPYFVSPSPDGSRLVVPEPDGVRLWAVD